MKYTIVKDIYDQNNNLLDDVKVIWVAQDGAVIDTSDKIRTEDVDRVRAELEIKHGIRKGEDEVNVVEKETKSGVNFSSSTAHVELIDVDGNSSVDSFNGQTCYMLSESSNGVTVGFVIPEDESASAFVYSLMLGGNIETVKSHRSNKDGVVYLTIKHDIQMVRDWSIGGGMIQIKFLSESSVVINGDISIEEESSDSSN